MEKFLEGGRLFFAPLFCTGRAPTCILWGSLVLFSFINIFCSVLPVKKNGEVSGMN